jgi:drug/metabolite transporter (DMT)-like permease
LKKPPRRAGELALLGLAAAAFATASPLAKAAHGMSFAGIAAGRCAIAAAALVGIAPRRTREAIAALAPKTRVAVAAAGLLLAAHFALFLAGLLSTSLAAAAALVSLEPLAVVVTAWLAFGERPSGSEAAGVALAAIGAAVVARGAGHGEHRLVGDALVLGAVLVYGAYVAFARGLRGSMATGPYAACVYGTAAIALAPVAAIAGRGDPHAPTATWAAVALLGLVPTLVGHTLLQRAARRLPPSVVALVSPGETVGAIAIGACTGHPPTAAEWSGATLVVAGALIATWDVGGR